ncbi:ribonuclease III [Amniculibacterium sp. G2-70]|uniref:ribonuclease III n=1 Tax=Amniculibacterium sp. G2-70 TaxID=2767188 RepID=UPI001653F098|nr:ribonuclease III [Amniculibacterium sp. G2-70]
MELKKYFSKFLKQRKKILSEKDFYLSQELNKLLGTEIRDVSIYREAFSLKSQSKNIDFQNNYERLEFLGDSVLGTIISCYIFHNYPKANEGYLTQLKSKIVNRKNLNKIGEQLDLKKFIQTNQTTTLSENITGNLFEALVGALFLDLEYEKCKEIVLNKLLTPEEITKLERKIVSYKSILLEWSQKKKVAIRYETAEEHQANKSIVFRCVVWLNGKSISNATDSSKKKAEEKAAQRAFYILNKKENILEQAKNNTPIRL